MKETAIWFRTSTAHEGQYTQLSIHSVYSCLGLHLSLPYSTLLPCTASCFGVTRFISKTTEFYSSQYTASFFCKTGFLARQAVMVSKYTEYPTMMMLAEALQEGNANPYLK